MSTTEGVLEFNGGQIYYDVSGSGKPVLLIHGFTVDRRMWDTQMDAFTEHYQVIRCDLRGFGKSSLPNGPYSFSADLDALLQHLGVTSAAVVGLSLGGSIVIDFALEFPQSVAALVPVDAGVMGYQWTLGRPSAAVKSDVEQGGLEAGKRAWKALPLFAPALEQPDCAAALDQMVADYSGFHWTNKDPVQYPDPPAIELLDTITCPTLVMVGERDLPDFHGVAETLERQISNAERVVMPGIGHLANMEDPANFNQLVLEFLNRSY